MAKPRRATNAHTSYHLPSAQELDDLTQQRQALLDAALGGSAEAHGALLESYRPEMLRYFAARLSPALHQKTGEDDLTQTACAHALRCFGRFMGVELKSYWAWLRHICQRVLMRLVRWFHETKRRLACEESLDELRLEDGSHYPFQQTQPPAEKILEARETMSELRAALDQLPEDERRILSLRYGEGLTLREVADRVGVSIDAVKRACQRGIARLRRRLAEATHCSSALRTSA